MKPQHLGLLLGSSLLGLIFSSFGPACSDTSSASSAGAAGAPPSSSGAAGEPAAGAPARGGASGSGGQTMQGGKAGYAPGEGWKLCGGNKNEWLCNPELWKPGSIPGACTLHELDLSKKPLPKREWESCGEGCQVATLKLPFAKGAYFTAHGATVNGETYLRSTMGWPDGGGGTMTTIHRVSDGETISAVLSVGACVSSMYALGYDQIHWQKDSTVTLGRFMPADGSIRWFQHTFENLAARDMFSLDDTLGFTTGSAVGLLTHFDDETPTFIENDGLHFIDSTAGLGQLAIWPQTEANKGSRIRGYNHPDEAVTLVEPMGKHIPRVALSDKHLAWVAVQGPKVLEGSYEVAEVYWADRPPDSPWPPTKNPKVLLSTSLPITHGLNNIRIAGEFAAVRGYVASSPEGKRTSVFVVHLPSGKNWHIFPRDGNGYGQILDLNDSKLLMSEISKENGGKAVYDRILWLDLDKLDEHAARWKPPPTP